VKTFTTPLCPYGHTINFENSEVFCTKKCGRPHLKNPSSPLVRKMSALNEPNYPLNADVFYGRPLTKFITFGTISVRISEQKIASYLKLKNNDSLFVSSAFWARIRPKTFLIVRPKPGADPNPARLTTLVCHVNLFLLYKLFYQTHFTMLILFVEKLLNINLKISQIFCFKYCTNKSHLLHSK